MSATMTSESTAREMSLPRAAMQLRVSGEVARRLMLRGALRGRQLPNGRWVVTTESVADAERLLAATAPASAPAA